MKKTGIAALILAGITVVGGAGLYAGRQIGRVRAIGEENAKIFACADAGVAAKEAEVRSAALGREDGRAVYTLEFEADGAVYRYAVDAYDGTVLRSVRVELPESAAQAVLEAPPQTTAQPPQTTAQVQQTAERDGKPVSEEEAEAIALAQFGLRRDEVDEVGLHFTEEDSGPAYLVYLLREGEPWYECLIDTASGHLLDTATHEWDELGRLDLFEARQQRTNRDKAEELIRKALSDGGPVTMKEAKRIALAYEDISPVHATFTEAEEDGGSYRLTCRTDGFMIWSWRIDAETGRRLESKRSFDSTGVIEMVLASEGQAGSGVAASAGHGYLPVGDSYEGPYWTVELDPHGKKTREYVVDPVTGEIRNKQVYKDSSLLAAEAAAYISRMTVSKAYAVQRAMERAGITAEDNPCCFIAEFDGVYQIDLFVKDKLWYECRTEVRGGAGLSGETHEWPASEEAAMRSCSERAFVYECWSADSGLREHVTEELEPGFILTMPQAKALALTQNLLTENAVSFKNIGYTTEDRAPVYVIAYNVGITAYEYRVDARTGVVTGGGRARPSGNAWDRTLEAAGLSEADLLCWTAYVSGYVDGYDPEESWEYILTLQLLNGTTRTFRVDMATGEIRETT